MKAKKEYKTTEQYWDCECRQNYIHPKSKGHCKLCNALREDQPDSIINEVKKAGINN